MTDPAASRTRTAAPPGVGPDDPPGPAPAVVVTVVAHDPGWWFDETLRSIARDVLNNPRREDEIRDLNLDKLDEDGLQIGQRLRLPDDATVRR